MKNNKLKDLWVEFIRSLNPQTSSAFISTYFPGTSPVEIKSNVLVIGVPNAFIKETLEKKYGNDILLFFKNFDKSINIVEFKTTHLKKEDSVNIHNVLKSNDIDTKKGELKIIPVKEKYSLNNFIVGDNNQLAYAASKGVSKKPGKLYNPLFIYGGVGLGKTHLLQAVANEIRRKNPEFNVVYTTAENFTNHLIESIHKKSVIRFRNKYREKVDVLILDDIQFVEGKEKTQEELFYTFNALHDAGKQIIFSSDKPPVELKTLEERLKSRFASGMVADITKPDLETRIAILRAKLQERGFLVETDVLQEIAEFMDTNVRELEAVLKQVIDESELMQIDPNVDLVRNIIKRLFPSKLKQRKYNVLDHESIISVVSEHFQITPSEIIGNSRKKHITTPRHISMYLIRESLGESLESIGEMFGGKNHTTVMHSINKAKSIIHNDMAVVKIFNKIKQDLGI